MENDIAYLALKSKQLKVLIVGGGFAGFIKLKSFQEKGAKVRIISKSFSKELEEYARDNEVELSYEDYNESLISKFHLIIIATSDDKLNEEIRKDCENNFKFYIDTTNGNKSFCTMPTTGQTSNMTFAIQTKGKSPKTSVFMRNLLSKSIKEYDEYVGFTVRLRNSIIDMDKKREVMSFVTSKDFLYFFNKGYGEKVLNLFYGGSGLEDSNKKK
ncbi:MAG: NAD(P)-dependent oxidoreductase [Clostridium sp.]